MLRPIIAGSSAEGISGTLQRVDAALATHTDPQKRAFLQSVGEALEGLAAYFENWSDRLVEAADASMDYPELLAAQSRIMAKLASEPPSTFWEAVQLVFSLHTVFQLDDRYAMALGRADQYLWPFLEADLAAGRVDMDFAQDLIDHFIAKLAHRGDIQNIAIGGTTREGEDAVNPVTFLLLEAVRRIQQPGGNLTARISPKNPDAFVEKCAEVIATGAGFPAVYNDDIGIKGLVQQGFPLEDARDFCFVGCIEIHIQGKHAPWSDGRFSLPWCANLALFDGWDHVTDRQAGPHTGEPATWEDFYEAYLTQVETNFKAHVEAVNAMKRQHDERPDDLTSPLLSALVDDCIARGLDVAGGGAIYPNNHGVAGMGIGTTSDSLMAIRKFVYEEGRFSLDELRALLLANFEGYEAERALLLRGAPKYGNDVPEVDALAREVAAHFGLECLKYRTPTGGQFWGLLGANISNIYAGRELGATADGRLAFEPLSDAASPTFGRDENGPTAVARSVANIDYSLLPGGNVVNMKFHPTAVAGEKGARSLAQLIRTCFELGGAQLQFNTNSRQLLLEAMEHPEAHRNLTVRVSGFSAYFVQLDRAVQEDILQRTEHSFGLGRKTAGGISPCTPDSLRVAWPERNHTNDGAGVLPLHLPPYWRVSGTRSRNLAFTNHLGFM